jgi:hypothetical protein
MFLNAAVASLHINRDRNITTIETYSLTNEVVCLVFINHIPMWHHDDK